MCLANPISSVIEQRVKRTLLSIDHGFGCVESQLILGADNEAVKRQLEWRLAWSSVNLFYSASGGFVLRPLYLLSLAVKLGRPLTARKLRLDAEGYPFIGAGNFPDCPSYIV
jgi:hypothetical protein